MVFDILGFLTNWTAAHQAIIGLICANDPQAGHSGMNQSLVNITNPVFLTLTEIIFSPEKVLYLLLRHASISYYL